MAAADRRHSKYFNNQPLYSFIVMSIERGYVRRRRRKQYSASRIAHLVGYPFWHIFTQKNIVTMAAADGPQRRFYNNQPLSTFTFISIERGYVRRQWRKQYFAGQNTHLVGYPFWHIFTHKNIITMAAADRASTPFLQQSTITVG